MAHWKVIETRSDLVTVERQGSAGMVSMAPAALGLKDGRDIALGASLHGDEDEGFTIDPAPHPQADPGDEQPAAAVEGESHGG